MSDEVKGIWTPDGVVTLDGPKLERVELRAGVGEWIRQFADVAESLQLGLHCARCKADLVGKNSDTSKVYATACKCRELIWPNRDWRPTPGPTVN